MKNFIFIFMLFIILIISSACTSNEQSPLIGEWEGQNVNFDMEFYTDGTLMMGIAEFKWSVSGKNLSVITGSETSIYSYEISNNILTLTMKNGDIYELKKK